jgi:hypothetical protein
MWKQGYRLLGINSPEVIDNPKSKKIFKLRFSYSDENLKKRTHVVYFGSKEDYIFSKNKDQRLKKILKMK